MREASQSAPDRRVRSVTSRQNAQVKELRRLFHAAAPNHQQEIAIEGVHLVEEAIRSGLRVSAVFAAEGARERLARLLPQVSERAEVLALPDEVFASAVPSETPQGIAALVRARIHALDDLLRQSPPLLVVAAGLQDPGNLGTIARSAEAFGATGLLIAEKTVSPWNWKAVRASVGSLFRLPWARVEGANALAELKSHGIAVLATSSHQGVAISEVDFTRPLALVVGNEGAGIAKEVFAQADEVIAIPHSPKVESLNAGIAASVVLYEASRQRRTPSPQRHRDTED